MCFKNLNLQDCGKRIIIKIFREYCFIITNRALIPLNCRLCSCQIFIGMLRGIVVGSLNNAQPFHFIRLVLSLMLTYCNFRCGYFIVDILCCFYRYVFYFSVRLLVGNPSTDRNLGTYFSVSLFSSHDPWTRGDKCGSPYFLSRFLLRWFWIWASMHAICINVCTRV